jgi:hypothetical protein
MWEHCSLRISIDELIELRSTLIVLMSSWFWWVSTIKVLSSWAHVVAIWKNEQENGIGETKGVWRGGWDHGEEGFQMIGTTAIREKRVIEWDMSQIRVLKKGWVHIFFVLKMIGITRIGAKRGTQWDRSQISVSVGPLYFFFFLLPELYSGLNNIAVLKFPNS